MLSENYLPLIRAIQSHGSKTQREFKERSRLFSLCYKDNKSLFVNASDLNSWVTCLDALSSSKKIAQLKILYNLCWQYFAESRILKPYDRDSHGILKLLNKGTVVLIRSQKIIIIERLANCVVHALREENSSEKHLLENEILANQVLPQYTIPVIFSHLDRQPYFFVQPYCPYSPFSYKIIINGLWEDIIECLFNYYDYFGLEPIDSHQYIQRLQAEISPSLQEKKGQPNWNELQRMFDAICTVGLKLATSCSNPPIYLTQSHGDLIPSHIVMPKRAKNSKFLLVDWSESHRYSVFHDLFYLQFQNYNTNFWDKFLSSGLDKYRHCYGGVWKKFCESLESRVKLKMDAHYADLNFLVCLLQELDHRLNRIHSKYLPFWVAQVKKIGVKSGD